MQMPASRRSEHRGDGADVAVRQELLVRRSQDLTDFRRAGSVRGVRVALDVGLHIDERQRKKLERDLNRGLAACGCNEGTLAGLLYLLLVPTLVMGSAIPWTVVGWLTFGAGLIASLLLGKAIGLLAARIRVLQALKQIDALTPSQRVR